MKNALSLAVLAATTATFAIATPAAAKPGDPIVVNDNLTIDPIIEGLLRWEHVNQDDLGLDADAVTIRMRAGAEAKIHNLSFLAEAEGTLAISDHYNDTIPGNNGYLGAEPYSVVADPENVEINRLQLSYKGKAAKVTIGRQRIILDDARFVGNVGWRQNEQTFDAVRGEGKVGPVSIDATYSISQRTIFGVDSPNAHFDGDFILVNAGIDMKPVKLVGFAYMLDYDTRLAFSSRTIGFMATGGVPLGGKAKLDFKIRYANQQDYKLNPVDYSADYIDAELGVSVAGFRLTGGYEELGSDDGVAAFQTPLATLHAFNGWADLFLTTPASGLRDYHGGVSKAFGNAGPLKGVKAAVIYHKFESDFGSTNYGQEWDASLGFQVAGYPILLKYANYDAKAFGTDTEKFWLQIGFKY
ncbi:alginate export family protein [Novosphingobium mangrovi (ex Huang et al. 2023)]|uniref:Alginate export family protein n=1 Tax=Novosphingobium mangrovi (ex Huang et al. 2023) TaxID=2976432 RepID=A0ABT2I2F1_9SPHN|nr:alginate export family protein [Novosphingobium mangrovi (ex Huang et al. 2023)]MCT2398787.1 alginate export family protein [Novosphingobium mangrovi (ex Huang et al. 2023)]